MNLCKGNFSRNIMLTEFGSDVRGSGIKAVIGIQAFYRGLIVPGTKKQQKLKKQYIHCKEQQGCQ